MKTNVLSIFMFLAVMNVQAQNYMIVFTGTGASVKVDSVKIENLSQCTTLSIAGTDTLKLTATVGIGEFIKRHYSSARIFPNPASGNCFVEFELTSGTNVYFGLYDISGKKVLRQKNYLPEGIHTFRLEGLERGLYSLEIRTDDYKYDAKLISTASESCCPVLRSAVTTNVISKQSYKYYQKEDKSNKNSKSVISMQFNAGDTLKLKGTSGNYRTVRMLFPNQSQTVAFDFVKCTDADSNNYAVVQIGSQLWMEENLKTTKYLDGSGIQNVQDSATWSKTTSGAWCDFRNNPAEGAYYGRLYNFYAVADSRKLCPFGWHVAANGEWNKMEKYLDNTVDTTALGGTGKKIGRILKESCTTRWLYDDTVSGKNSVGFTALCTNFRNATGAWSLAPDDNHDDSFWTSTAYNTKMAWNKSFRWCYGDIYSIFNFDRAGSSVRCIKDY
jgi:uncharacterized protein (TIGR02145 family)